MLMAPAYYTTQLLVYTLTVEQMFFKNTVGAISMHVNYKYNRNICECK